MTKLKTPPETKTPLFRLYNTEPGSVLVDFEGEQIKANACDTVASVLLRHIGPQDYRQHSVTGAPRAPLCMMGVCFECLVEIDGQSNQQACMVQVRPSMRIRRQIKNGDQA